MKLKGNKINPKIFNIHKPRNVMTTMRRLGKSNSMPEISQESKVNSMNQNGLIKPKSRVLGVYQNKDSLIKTLRKPNNFSKTTKPIFLRKNSNTSRRQPSRGRRGIGSKNIFAKSELEVYSQHEGNM